VHRAEGDDLQDQQVERALRQVGFAVRHDTSAFYISYVEARCVWPVAGGAARV
jgi:hypothetical protein